MNAKEREAEFRAALDELCKKHGAELTLTDNGKPYGMASPVLLISIDGEYDKDGNTLKEFCQFEW